MQFWKLNRRIGVTFKDRFGLVVSDSSITPPSEFRSVDVIWHARLSSHPAQIWMRQLLREVAQSTEAETCGITIAAWVKVTNLDRFDICQT